MREIAFDTTRVLCYVSVLLVLYASAALASDPNQPAASTKDRRFAQRMEFINRPAIDEARAILKRGGDLLDVFRYGKEKAKDSDAVKRAERVVRQWDNGSLDPEPILLTVTVATREFSKTSGNLELTVLDEDGDLLGLRIREKYRLPNGVESVFEEDYPVYVDLKGLALGEQSLLVRYRSGLQVKDGPLWRRYVEQARNDADSSDPGKVRSLGSVVRFGRAHALTMPPVWISIPEPNRIEVSVSVYDEAGYESESVPVTWWPIAEEDVPASETLEYDDYQKHRLKIARWPDKTAVSRPDNAALLYYRATACLAKPDPCTARIIHEMGWGGEPDDRVRAHLGRCLKGIQLAQLASQIPECDWGLFCDAEGAHTMETLASLRRLSFTLADHARTLAADEHYRVALENCLVIRRLSRHIGDDAYLLYLVSRAVDAKAIFLLLDFLGDMPADMETLTWLCEQLATVEGAPARRAVALEKWCGRKFYDVFIDSAVRIMESDLPYQEKQAQLRELERAPGGRTKLHELAIVLLDVTPDVQKYHELMVRDQTFLGCAKVAVKVLLVAAQTGRSPEALPEGLPKDPYTGEDFQYERTKTGFVIGLDPENLSRMRKREFTFTVSDP